MQQKQNLGNSFLLNTFIEYKLQWIFGMNCKCKDGNKI